MTTANKVDMNEFMVPLALEKEMWMGRRCWNNLMQQK